MQRAERQALIEQYKQGPAVVAAALAGLSEEQLDARPADGGWSARLVAHHLADGEFNGAIRLRKLLVEAHPVLQGYDELAYAGRLWYTDRPLAAALDALRAARATTAELLDRLREEDWRRAGWHTELGRFSVETWLQEYALHAHEHAEQISRAAGAVTLAETRRP